MTDLVEYRMWDKDKQEMFYGPIVDEYRNKVDEDDDRYVFMRCTLHRDILNTKAYVGDILKQKDNLAQPDNEKELEDKYSYIWHDEEDGLCITDPFNNRRGNLKSEYLKGKIIVGNRFQNPNIYKLLKSI